MPLREDDLQKACVQYFNIQFPNRVMFHVPNGGYRHPREAVKFKKLGVISGIPDLVIPEPNGFSSGLFIELKVGKNTLTENQKRMIAKLQVRGYSCHVCRSFDEFKTTVREYFSHDKEKTQKCFCQTNEMPKTNNVVGS